MKIIRAYKRELDPNNRTKTLLSKNAGASRFAYNWSLARRIERFNTQEDKEKFTNSKQELKELVKIKQQEFPWMLEVSNRSVESAIRDLDRAFSNFWKNHKSSGIGFPRFKKKGVSVDSFRLYGSIKPLSRYIQLPKLGKIRLKEKIEKITGRITSATVSRVADRWYVFLLVEEEIEEPKPIEGRIVGIDLGINSFAMVSDDTEIESPRPLKKLEKKLNKAQKAKDRKEKCSKNRRKAVLQLARIHRKIANIRSDFLHRISTELTKTKATIVVEDLNVKGMMKNHRLAKSISDQGWGMFVRFLEYKTGWYGSELLFADRWFASSKICHNCDYRLKKLPLHIREWTCPQCGTPHKRDKNASINLEFYPLKYKQSHKCWGTLMPVEVPMAAELGENSRSTSYGSLKQEAGSGFSDKSR